jgi:hypothetical protein
MTARVGGLCIVGARDHFEPSVSESDITAPASIFAVLVVNSSFTFEVVKRGYHTAVGSSVRKLFSSLAQIIGKVSWTNRLPSSKCSLVWSGRDTKPEFIRFGRRLNACEVMVLV